MKVVRGIQIVSMLTNMLLFLLVRERGPRQYHVLRVDQILLHAALCHVWGS